uniref:Uncharacterized protein LOC111123171 isoform X1 n=1 Tax=Crassostrea virginica TaxID=6565 RepID=A0A8B8CZQ2_CRAVI|nr:uncharacterized protein LOC111123171 isoform X1 [Crassostrea virginica]
MEYIYIKFGHLVFLQCICLIVSAYVETVIQNPVLYNKENMSVICRPDPAHRDSIESVRMIRVYVEHHAGSIGTTASKLSRITNMGAIQYGPANTARYIVTGSITTVEAAYLEVFVNARDVMCSDSRLFRCEMDFILKNKTEATDIKDDATCIKGPCNSCFTGLQNFEARTETGTENLASTMKGPCNSCITGLQNFEARTETGTERLATAMKDPLIIVGAGLAVLGILSLVCGAILIVKSKRSKTEVAGPFDNTLHGFENSTHYAGLEEAVAHTCRSPENALSDPTHYADLDEVIANRRSVQYLSSLQKRQNENPYSSLN